MFTLVVTLLACTGTPGDTGPDDTGPGDTGPGDTSETADTGDTTDSRDTADSGDSADTTDPGAAAWADFEAAREDHLRALGAPILACVARDDSGWPAFHGCYDWHSAVHGHWALLALSRVLGEPEWAEAAEANLTPEALEGELALLEAGGLAEIPYGYAWFLKLTDERSLGGEEDLEPLAEVVAEALAAWLDDARGVSGEAGVLADDYANLSWAAVQLGRWAERRGDAPRLASARSFLREVAMGVDCPLEEELSDTDNFLPACLVRAHAVLAVLDPAETEPWLAPLLPADYPLTPVTEIQRAHTAGLNFSRPWGLWSIWAATGDPRWRDMYREHVEWHLAHPEYWAENYDYYAHWVPQFGVYAIVEGLDHPAD